MERVYTGNAAERVDHPTGVTAFVRGKLGRVGTYQVEEELIVGRKRTDLSGDAVVVISAELRKLQADVFGSI
jgi:hypothetical protein